MEKGTHLEQLTQVPRLSRSMQSFIHHIFLSCLRTTVSATIYTQHVNHHTRYRPLLHLLHTYLRPPHSLLLYCFIYRGQHREGGHGSVQVRAAQPSTAFFHQIHKMTQPLPMKEGGNVLIYISLLNMSSVMFSFTLHSDIIIFPCCLWVCYAACSQRLAALAPNLSGFKTEFKLKKYREKGNNCQLLHTVSTTARVEAF